MQIKTTAQLREEARAAQQRLDWAAAARLYDAAADAYPTKLGALGAADISALRRSASTCRAMVESVAA